MKIGVVGSGISGLGAAWLLNRRHYVRLFEKRTGLGGHTNIIVHSMDGCELFLARSGRAG